MTGEDDTRRRRRRPADARATGGVALARSLPTSPTDGGAGLDLAAIEAAAVAILADIGIACQLPPEVIERCIATGLAATPTSLKFPEARLRELMALGPGRFVHAARDSARSLEISSALSTFGPALTAAHIWEGATRRPMRSADAALIAAVADDIPALGLGAAALHLVAEDISAPARLAAFGGSTRPLLAIAGSGFHARDQVAAVDASADCRLMIAAPVEAALTFGDALIEAMIATGAGGQGLIIAPTILIGANAPATRAGALVRFCAEAMAGVALAQALAPGQPVAVGGTFAEVSMRNGLPLVGTARVIGVLGGAIALARRWQLPFFALGPATNAKGFDALGTAETSRWLTAAYHLGANAIIGAIGAVDLDDGVSLEKLVVDAETASALTWPNTPIADDFAADLIAAGPGASFLGTAAARQLARTAQHGRLTDNRLFESWIADGSPSLTNQLDTLVAATKARMPAYEAPDGAPDGKPGVRPPALTDLAATIYSRSMREAFGFKS
jgi:trimethylamine:corrinoid methyltransferase-like protein